MSCVRRFGASGEFAEAYVLAHEVGHHVQSLLGVDSQMRQTQAQQSRGAKRTVGATRTAGGLPTRACGRMPPTSRAVRTQGRMELEPGDLEDGLRAAAAIGDDRIQRMSTGHVFPDKFTHGTSEQRVTWLRRGFESGTPDACQTFQ